MIYDLFSYKYQPIVDLKTLSIVRYEALLQADDTLEIEPLIRDLEREGQISELDLFSLESIVGVLNRRRSDVKIAVNISPISICCPYFQQEALSLIGMLNDPTSLSLEITERGKIRTPEAAKRLFSKLQRKGISLGLDDIGDGDATTDVVAEFCLDYLKLSSKLTIGIERSERKQKEVKKILAFAKERDLPVVAEHIEMLAQADWLTQAGCGLGQGWLYGKAEKLPPRQN